jgi:hypothetical protein
MSNFNKLLLLAASIFLSQTKEIIGNESIPIVNMRFIAEIESNNNPNAINKNEKAYGLFQIRQCVLTDFNKKNKTSLKLKDLLNPSIAFVVADWQMHIRIPELIKYTRRHLTEEIMIRVWNAGIGAFSKDRFPESTRKYLIKYKEMERKELKNEKI